MTSEWINVRVPNDPIYEVLIKKYWNWLLQEESVVDKPTNELENGDPVLFMRLIYGYTNRWEVSSPMMPKVARRNIERVNRMGGAGKENMLEFPHGKPIFLPVIDSCEGDFDRDMSGNQLTPQMMNKILEAENDDVESKIKNGNIRATIRRLDNDSAPQEIVENLADHRIGVPGGRTSTSTFKIDIPNNSRLAQSFEFEFPIGKTVNARAQGIYVIFDVIEPGDYQIRSSAEGLRNYKAYMNYYIHVT